MKMQEKICRIENDITTTALKILSHEIYERDKSTAQYFEAFFAAVGTGYILALKRWGGRRLKKLVYEYLKTVITSNEKHLIDNVEELKRKVGLE